jgi:hypothetical protein
VFLLSTLASGANQQIHDVCPDWEETTIPANYTDLKATTPIKAIFSGARLDISRLAIESRQKIGSRNRTRFYPYNHTTETLTPRFQWTASKTSQ